MRYSGLPIGKKPGLTGTHVPYGITECYLPPGRGSTPAHNNAAEAGTRFSDYEGMQGWVELGTAVRRSPYQGCISHHDKHNCPRWDSNLGPLTPQAETLITRRLWPVCNFVNLFSHLPTSAASVKPTNVSNFQVPAQTSCPRRGVIEQVFLTSLQDFSFLAEHASSIFSRATCMNSTLNALWLCTAHADTVT